jgi:glucokinase
MTHAYACGRFAVLNDFEAIGYGVPVVPKEDLVVLHDAPVCPKASPAHP